MTVSDVLSKLEALGTGQNQKVYRRHGVEGEVFGVSYGNLNKLKKRIKVNHPLALELWDTGNHDARVLATMIADPEEVSERLLATWVSDLTNSVITDAFSAYVKKTALAQTMMGRWTRAKGEWRGQAGWQLLSHLASKEPSLPDDFFHPFLETIATDIHGSKNRVRYSMNGALIAIGGRSEGLEVRALAVAAQIGTVEVDHGQTNCKTPDAATYILKRRARIGTGARA